MPKLRDHVIICSWTAEACEIIRALHAEEIREESKRYEKREAHGRDPESIEWDNPWHPVVVISEEMPIFPDEDSFEDTLLIPGSPLNGRVLQRANIQDARAIVIIPSAGETTPDDKILRIALQIRSTLEELKPERWPWIVAGVVDPRNAEPYRRTDITGIHEVISPTELGLKLLAQANISPGVTFVLNDLLRYSDDSNELYMVSVPEKWSIGDRPIACMKDLYEVIENNGGRVILPGALVVGFAVHRKTLAVGDHHWDYFINPGRNRLSQRRDEKGELGPFPLTTSDKLIVLARNLGTAREVAEPGMWVAQEAAE